MIDYKRRYEAFAEFKQNIERRLEVWMKEHAEDQNSACLLLPPAPEKLEPEISRFAIGVTASSLPGLTKRLMDAAAKKSNIILVLPCQNGEWFVYARGEIQKRFTGPDAHAEASAYASRLAAELSDGS